MAVNYRLATRVVTQTMNGEQVLMFEGHLCFEWPYEHGYMMKVDSPDQTTEVFLSEADSDEAFAELGNIKRGRDGCPPGF